jgi:hypothetical protein
VAPLVRDRVLGGDIELLAGAIGEGVFSA